jgi:magnesium-transporting ATPase (P-type)
VATHHRHVTGPRDTTDPGGRAPSSRAKLDERGVSDLVIATPHARPVEEVLAELGVDREGLSGGEARRRLEEVGPNRLPDPPRESSLRRMARHVNDILIYILLVAVAVTALLQHWIDAAVILGVVVANAVIGYAQEGRAEQALAGIRQLLSLDARARRDGGWMTVPGEVLVPGDVIRLQSGDRVPADARLVDTTELRVEESALTGESVPTDKHPQEVPLDASLGDRSSMVFSGSLVASGRGTAVVTGTGTSSEIGRISTLIGEVETLATPLTRQMNQFGRQLSMAIVGLAAVLIVIGRVLHDEPLADLFLAAIGFAVAAIPEGLPAILTITLAVGVQRMAGRNAITRRLNAIETLGSVTVICSDKTGTLTMNEMTVREVVTPDGHYLVTGSGYTPDGHIHREGIEGAAGDRPDLLALIEALAVVNDAHVTAEGGQWQLSGEPTEGALMALALKYGFDPSDYERWAEVPFESEHKLMATLNLTPDARSLVLAKGAPDRLLERSRLPQASGGQGEALDPTWWEARIDELGSRGLRVLAAARRDAGAEERSLDLADLDSGLTFLGIVGIADPPRPEAVTAVAACKAAGITVKMITGDHPGTAMAIAREMGIAADDATAVTGPQLEAASHQELTELARRHDVFARTSPEHKLRLVTALQADGEVVAMTGDGVNDAPALKRADVGVAMGVKGTEATKEAAEIVLADDNFASIVRAVEEGRTIYDNLRKSILFILPTNGAEALVIMVAVVLGLRLPLTPTQILWVNMVTAVTLALALAFEPTEPGIMRRPPRTPGTSLLDAYFLWRIAFVGTLMGGATIAVFLLAERAGLGLEVARTLAINTLVFSEVCYLFNCRFLQVASFPLARLLANRAAGVAVASLVVLQLGFVHLPFMNTVFGTAPLAPHHWAIAMGTGLVVFGLVEVEKAATRAGRSAGLTTP